MLVHGDELELLSAQGTWVSRDRMEGGGIVEAGKIYRTSNRRKALVCRERCEDGDADEHREGREPGSVASWLLPTAQ